MFICPQPKTSRRDGQAGLRETLDCTQCLTYKVEDYSGAEYEIISASKHVYGVLVGQKGKSGGRWDLNSFKFLALAEIKLFKTAGGTVISGKGLVVIC